MGEDRLSELLGYRWRGSYLQRNRTTVWFNAEHFFMRTACFKSSSTLRRAKESSAVKKKKKKKRTLKSAGGMNGGDVIRAVKKRFMGRAAQVVWRSWAFHWLHLHCAVHRPQWIPGPRRAIWTLSASAIIRWPAAGLLAGAFLSTALVKLLNLSCRPEPAPSKKKPAVDNEPKFADRLTQTMWQRW